MAGAVDVAVVVVEADVAYGCRGGGHGVPLLAGAWCEGSAAGAVPGGVDGVDPDTEGGGKPGGLGAAEPA